MTPKFFAGHTKQVNSVTFVDETIASGSHDGNICFWNINAPRCLRTDNHHNYGIKNVSTASATLITSIGYDRTVRLLDVTTKRYLPTNFISPTTREYATCNNATGLLAICGDDKNIRLWQVKQQQLYATFTGHQSNINTAVFSANGKMLASADWHHVVCLWSVPDKKLLYELPCDSQLAFDLAFSHDGKFLAIGTSDHNIKIWNTANKQLVCSLANEVKNYTDLVFAPNGVLAIAISENDDNSILFYSVTEKKSLYSLHKLPLKPLCLAFNDNGKLLAIGGIKNHYGTICLWDTATQRCIAAFDTLPGKVTNIEWLENNSDKFIICGDSTGAVRVFKCLQQQNQMHLILHFASQPHILNVQQIKLEGVSGLSASNKDCLCKSQSTEQTTADEPEVKYAASSSIDAADATMYQEYTHGALVASSMSGLLTATTSSSTSSATSNSTKANKADEQQLPANKKQRM